MITKEEFETAKIKVKEYQKIVDDYLEQQQKILEQKQFEKEENCPGHEYEYTNTRWRPANEQQCIHCGKII